MILRADTNTSPENADPENAARDLVRPRHQQVIMTIYGLYAREEGGALPVAALIRMLGDLGIEEAGVRSSVSRMKRRGILESCRNGGVAQYGLSSLSLEIIVEGDTRIYSRIRATADDRWLLIVFSIPEAERDKRHKLRSQLTNMGFGAVAPGVWIAPAALYSETSNRLARLGLAPYVELFSVDNLTSEQMAAKVDDWWDLPSLDALYQQFIEKYTPMRDTWLSRIDGSVSKAPDPKAAVPKTAADQEDVLRQSFVDYVYMFTHWRRMPFLDPGLPLEFLPGHWSGVRAERVFSDIHESIGPLAHEYVHSIIHAQDHSPAMTATP